MAWYWSRPLLLLPSFGTVPYYLQRPLEDVRKILRERDTVVNEGVMKLVRDNH